MMIRFVVDELCWKFPLGLAAQLYIEKIEKILDRLEDAQSSGHTCCFSDELFNQPVYENFTFYELYTQDSPIAVDVELQQRIAAIFGRMSTWQDIDLEWPDVFDVELSPGVLSCAPSIAWALKQSHRNIDATLACVSDRLIGLFPTKKSDIFGSVWFVFSERSVEEFFRWLILETTHNPDEMRQLAGDAFKNLEFVDNAFEGIKKMSKPYCDISSKVVKHLAVLSDEGKRIFSEGDLLAPKYFAACGVDISNENGNTKQNATALKARSILVNGETRIFWWHSKIDKHQDRIHICPKQLKITGKILVGIFCKHLPV